MNSLCKSLYESKLKIMEIYDNMGKSPSSKINYIVEEKPSEFLCTLYPLAERLFFTLRENQDIVFNIVQNANSNEAKASLASLLTNCFYENILSSSFIEDEYLLLIYRLLDSEIEKLKQTNSPLNFLDNTPCSYFLRSLSRKDDIKAYFGKMINDIVIGMESKEDNYQYTFDVQRINEEIIAKKLEIKKKMERMEKMGNIESKRCSTITGDQILKASLNDKDIGRSDSSIDMDINSNTDFFRRYILDIMKGELVKSLEKETNDKMKEYISKQMGEYKRNNDNLYSNSEFLVNVYKTQESSAVLSKVEMNFLAITDIINTLFDKFVTNSSIIPYSIKCICKMISYLITKRFPGIIDVERNAFIAEFFFESLLKPIFTVPDYNCLLTSVFLSEKTSQNIILVQRIIKQLVSGSFYKSKDNSNLVIFNWYFIEIMPKVMQFFNCLTDVKLPGIIEKLIKNDKDPNSPFYIDPANFRYNYFLENPNEKINHVSICFNIEDLSIILEILKSKEKQFFPDYGMEGASIFTKTYKKLKTTTSSINRMKEIKSSELPNKTKTYVILTKINLQKDFKTLIETKDNFSKIAKIKKTQESSEYNLEKVKGYLVRILLNFQAINREDFPIKTFSEFLDKIKELSNVEYYLLDTLIPIDWYAISIKELLHQIPEEYKKDDYSLLYTTIAEELEQLMQERDIAPFLEMKDKLKYTEREIKNIGTYLGKLNQVERNKQILLFIEKEKVSVSYKMVTQQNGCRKLIISKEDESGNNKFKYLDSFLFENKPKRSEVFCKDIPTFIKKFPNFIKYSNSEPALFEFENDLGVPEALRKYFKIVRDYSNKFFAVKDKDKEKSDKKKKEDKKEERKEPKKDEEKEKEEEEKRLFQIYTQIYSYIMSKLYEKLFPPDAESSDIKVYQQCVRHSWVEPQHIIHQLGLNLINFLPESQRYFEEFDTEKSPIAKMEPVECIKKKVNQLVSFATGKLEQGIDDIQDYFVFALLKTQPRRLYSNLKYVEMYLDESFKMSQMSQNHTILRLSQDYIISLNYSPENIKFISEEEYNR